MVTCFFDFSAFSEMLTTSVKPKISAAPPESPPPLVLTNSLLIRSGQRDIWDVGRKVLCKQLRCDWYLNCVRMQISTTLHTHPPHSRKVTIRSALLPYQILPAFATDLNFIKVQHLINRMN